MKILRIDKDSLSTIIWSWAICLAIIFISLRFIPLMWVSVPISVLAAVFMGFITFFFRIPDRITPSPEDKGIVTSVADGEVVIVDKVFENEFLRRECIQVSVYMDFFDVHCNFWPVTGKIVYYKYHPGKKVLAYLPKSSELNEHASSCLETEDGRQVFFKQIAGTFARRIVCYSVPGSYENRGEQCGVIKFGSRVDMFLPTDAEIKVSKGDKVKAVESVIAVLPR